MNPESIEIPTQNSNPKEVMQWLNEVKSLQQQVRDLTIELATAQQNADSWRSRYETEGQQRRSDVTTRQDQINKLKAEIAQLRTQPEFSTTLSDDAIVLQINGITSMSALQGKLFKVWTDRDNVLAALKKEQLAHEKTKKDLTMALADAMDVLTPKNKNNSAQPTL
jgi:predicted RNase H-like nuclease (RuvC/YqgF family)